MPDQEKKVLFSLDAKIDGLLASLQQGKEATQAATGAMGSAFGAVSGGINTLMGGVGLLTGILAGGAMFKGVISETLNWDGSVGKLAKTLGDTTQNASILKVQLQHLGIDQDLVSSAAMKMAKTMNTGSDAFKQIGVDAEGMSKSGKSNIEIMMETVKALGEYKGGLDRNQAAMSIFGRSWGELQPLMKLTAAGFQEAEKRARELHLIVGPEGVAAAKKYKEELADLELVKTSLAHTAGTELLGALVEVGAMMQGPATTAARIFAGAVHEVHLGMRDIIDDHNDLAKTIDRTINAHTINAMTLFMTYQAVRKGNFSMIPKIIGAGVEAGHNMNANPMDMSKETMDGVPDGHDKKWGGKGGGGGTSAAEKKNYAESAPSFMNWRNNQAEEAEGAKAESEYFKQVDEVARNRAKLTEDVVKDWGILDSGLNSPLLQMPKLGGILGADGSVSGGMPKFSLTGAGQTSGVMGNDASSIETAKETAEKLKMTADFKARKMVIEGDSTALEMARINIEEQMWLDSWAKMGGSFEENERRKTEVAKMASDQRADVAKQAAEKQAAAWEQGAQKYVDVAQSMTTMGVQLLLADKDHRGQIEAQMLATSVRFIGQGLQQYMMGKAKEHLLNAAAMAGAITTKTTQAATEMTIGATQATAWAAFYSAQSLNPFGGQAFIPAATAMTAAAAGFGVAGAGIAAEGATGMASELGMAAAWGAGGILAGAMGEAGAGAIGSGGSSGNTTGYGGGTAPGSMVTQPTSTTTTQQQGHLTIKIDNMMGDAKWVEENLVPLLNEAGTRGVTIEYPK